MDERRQELEALQEELHLALLMDEYAERMGKQVRGEAEAAFESGELEIPSEVDEACYGMIDNAPSVKPAEKPARAFARYALVAALTVVLLFGALFAVQAAGINVFGRLATWTDSVLRFDNSDNEETQEPHADQIEPENQIQETLLALDMPIELAPTWFPDGYEITQIETETCEFKITVNVILKNAAGKSIVVYIDELFENDLDYQLYDGLFEKTETEPLEYISGSRRFYLFENGPGWCGAWVTERYRVSIINIEAIETLQKMIDSMGEYNET